MIVMSTLEGDKKSASNIKTNNDATSEISSNLGTMVINDEEGDDDTMVTRKGESSNYRPPYLDHFDNPPAAKNKKETSIMPPNSMPTQNHSGGDNIRIGNSEKNNLPDADVKDKAQDALDKRLLEQISGGQIQDGPVGPPNHSSATQGKVNTVPNMGSTGDQGQGK